MVQASMHRVRTLTFLLAISVLAFSASAQQSADAQFADRLTPASLETSSSIPADNLAPVTSGPALFRPTTPKLQPQRKFFDRRQLLALYVHSGIRLADTIKTCRSI